MAAGAAEHEFAKTRVPVATHHHQICSVVLGARKQSLTDVRTRLKLLSGLAGYAVPNQGRAICRLLEYPVPSHAPIAD
jgi:hypothetical protein